MKQQKKTWKETAAPVELRAALPELKDAKAGEAAEKSSTDTVLSPVTSCSLREPGQQVVRAAEESTAVSVEVLKPKRKKLNKSEAQTLCGQKIKAGELPDPRKAVPRELRQHGLNPLMKMPESRQELLMSWHRACVPEDNLQQMMLDHDMPKTRPKQLNDFFEWFSEYSWKKRLGVAAQEARGLVRYVENCGVHFPSAVLDAVGQQAFRYMSKDGVDPDTACRYATVMLRTQSNERVAEMHELRREKLRNELAGQLDQALEKLADEVDKHPGARTAFKALRVELDRGRSQEAAQFLTE